jgi:sulfofructose kinase
MRSQQGQVQPKRLVAVGTVSITTIYRVETIPAAPAKVLANQACRVVDGMAVSAACAFVRLGGQATAWARVGDDVQGVHMREALLAEGIDISCLRTVSGTASSHVSVLVDAKGQRLVVPFHDLDVDDSAGWLPLATLKQADMVHCDARWVNGAEAALKAASALGLPRMIDGDVAPKEVLDRLVPLATHAVFSDAGLLGYTGASSVERALLHIASCHAGHVGASCGADGYFWVEDGKIHHVDSPVVNVVDTLSAGDVFHGAFALALLEGQLVAEAARFACVAAALKCTRFGGRLGCPNRQEVDSFLLPHKIAQPSQDGFAI